MKGIIVGFPVSPDRFKARRLAREIKPLNAVPAGRLRRDAVKEIRTESARNGDTHEEQEARAQRFNRMVDQELAALRNLEGVA